MYNWFRRRTRRLSAVLGAAAIGLWFAGAAGSCLAAMPVCPSPCDDADMVHETMPCATVACEMPALDAPVKDSFDLSFDFVAPATAPVSMVRSPQAPPPVVWQSPRPPDVPLYLLHLALLF